MPDSSEDFEELEIPDQARQCWRKAMDSEHDFREAFDKRMRFQASDQWDESDISARGKDRPAIVVNLLEQPVQQIVNQNLRNQPGGKVSPADDEANPEVAEYWQGRIRHIEYASDSQVAYGKCVGYVAAGGVGYIGLSVDYVAPDSFDQEVRIRPIYDPANWAIDRTATEPDKRDMRWAIGRQKFSVEEFKRRWPDAEVVDASFYGEDPSYADWGDGRDVWVGEYWRLTYKKRKLQRFSDGSKGFLDDKDLLRRLSPSVQALPGSSNVREVDFPVVTQYLVSGSETLDETPWKGTRIPIYEVCAREFYAEGKRIVKSATSDSLPSCQTYNCSESLKLESLVMAPKPKWLVSVAQIEGHEVAWKNANTSSDATLFYNGLADSRGNPVPPPDWKVFVPPIQQFQLVSDGAKQDVKLQTGFFDAALGNFDSQDRAAKAIIALQGQTDQGTFHYSAALAGALKSLYQDIIEIDGKLNTQPRMNRIIKPDGKHDMARVNDPNAQRPLLLSKGRYEVIVSVGPSDKSNRDAAGEFIDTVAEHDPEGWALIRDIGARIKEPQLGHYSDEIAARWTPPQFAQQDPNAPPLPPQAQQAMAAVPQLQQQVAQLSQIIQQKQVEEQGKADRAMQQEQMAYQTEQLKASAQIRVAELQAKNDTYLAEIDARVKMLESAADRGHEANLQAHKQAHEAGITAAKHVHAVHQQQEQHDHERSQAEFQAAQMPPPDAGGDAGNEAGA